jgi:hypothetical protein
MAQFQTIVNNLNVMRGNGVLSLAKYTTGEPEWIEAGAIADLNIDPDAPVAREENDNADATERFNKIEFKIGFTQLELLKLEIWEILYDGLADINMNSSTTEIDIGHLSQIPTIMCKIETENDGKHLEAQFFKCSLAKLFSFKYAKDDAEDARIKNPIELLAKSDANRANKVVHLEGNFNG